MRQSDVTEAMRNAQEHAARQDHAKRQDHAARWAEGAAAELEVQLVTAVGWASVVLECELLAGKMRERGVPADHIVAEGLEARANLVALLGEGEGMPGAALVERALEIRREALQ